VIIHSSDELYGADRMVLQVALALSEVLGAEVEVWLPDDVKHPDNSLCDVLTDRGIRWQHASLPILRRAYLRPQGIWYLGRTSRSLRRMFHERPFDVVYCATSACLLAARVARGCGTPLVVLHLQELWSGFEARVLRRLARNTNLRIAISTAVRDAAKFRGAAPVVIENCVEPPRVRVRQSPDAAGPRYVVASRWNSWKGHGTLIRAWALAGCPGHLTILGGAPPIGASIDVRQMVANHVNRPETVDIVGEVADISDYIAAADALVLPSDAPEPFGLVVIEAFAAGRAVIASRGGGPLEIITEGQDGWFFELGDPHSLAELFTTLSVADLRLAGRRARRIYEEQYTPERYRHQIAAIVGEHLSLDLASNG